MSAKEISLYDEMCLQTYLFVERKRVLGPFFFGGEKLSVSLPAAMCTAATEATASERRALGFAIGATATRR